METALVRITGSTLEEMRAGRQAASLTVRPELARALGPEQSGSLNDVRRAVAALKAAGTRKNTSKAHRAAEACWKRYCAVTGLPESFATDGVLDGYAMWLIVAGRADGGALALTSADTRLGNTIAVLRDCGVPFTKTDTESAWATLRAAGEMAKRNNTHETGRGQAVALPFTGLVDMVAACDLSTLEGLRDRALALSAWALMARSSELADLQDGDVRDETSHDHTRYVTLTVREGKTESSARSNRVSCEPGPYCVATALSEYRAALATALGRIPSRRDPLFRPVYKSGRVGARPMSADMVTNALKGLGRRAGLGAPVTGHSIRSGAAGDAKAQGYADHEIARMGGWKPGSAELYRYLRADTDPAKDVNVSRMRRDRDTAALTDP